MSFRLKSYSQDHFNMMAASAEGNMDKYLEELCNTATDENYQKFKCEMNNFKSLFKRFIKTRNDTIEWSKISLLGDDDIVPMTSLETPSNPKSLVEKLCVMKLNGGLGTTMGCVGPKSAIEVREYYSFLDLCVKQIKFIDKTYGTHVPLILMNSFNTSEDTKNILQKYNDTDINIMNFEQSRFPRVLKDSLLPVPSRYDSPLEEWYPPGHGDMFKSFYHSGLLEELISQGKEYLFLSNIDNLAATLDLSILNYMDQNECEFLMEVTDKTKSDIKGGTIIKYEDKIRLLEIAQVPPQYIEEFKSIKKFKVFNTNNIWISLKAIKNAVESEIINNIDIILNLKTVRDKTVIQLETAVGAAIQFFKNSRGINVPRDRFLPVKNTSDLLSVQSDIYKLVNGTLVMNPQRSTRMIPNIRLGAEFKDVQSYNRRFDGIPDILELDQLIVTGDVKFGSSITLRGTVIILATCGTKIDLPSGSVLENKIITGDLHIIEY